MKSKFIVFEGSDGSGKTTILKNIITYLNSEKIDYIVTREPGGTEVSEKIRDMLLKQTDLDLSDRAEALLFAAARAQLVEEVIRPALDSNKLVISDRYVMSSIAYQGYGRKLGSKNVLQINEFAIGGLKPDFTFFFDVDPIKVLDRKSKLVKQDRLEMAGNSYHQMVYDGYKDYIKNNPKGIIVIDASKSIEEVTEQTLAELKKIIGG